MAISFKCEHCRRDVTAPDEAAGKRGKCPYCDQSNYIPSPVPDEDILDLAPVDEADERRRKEEIHRLVEQEKAIMAERGEKAPVPLEHREDLGGADLHHFVVNYCLDLNAGKMARLRTFVEPLRRFKAAGVQAVEDFISGKVSEPALKHIQPRALKTFLTQLRDELRQ
jgi:hypothetical protein